MGNGRRKKPRKTPPESRSIAHNGLLGARHSSAAHELSTRFARNHVESTSEIFFRDKNKIPAVLSEAKDRLRSP
jgi:hypothetical protein